MAEWNPWHLPNLSAATAVVTGANSGLGYVVARELARRDARIVLACRNQERGEQALDRLRGETGSQKLELHELDLSDLSSVARFAKGIDDPLDILVNNAGVMAIPRRTTADGFEMQFGTNHLGHFALTGLLLPRLLERPGARVVTVTSEMHRYGWVRFDDLMGERRYVRWLAYCQSKLANLLFALELARRTRAAGVALDSVAAHPGYASTNLQLVGPRMRGSRLGEGVYQLANRVIAQPADAGALPLLYAAAAPEAANGQFLGPDGPFGLRGNGVRAAVPSRAARNEETARRLWDVSEQLTGVSFPPPFSGK